MRVKGYFSIRCSDVVEDETVYTETLNELDGFILPIEYKSTSGSLALKIASNEKQITQVELLEKFRFPFCDNILLVEGEITSNYPYPEEIISKRINDLFILTTICKNGIIDCPAGHIYINGNQKLSCDPLVHNIDFIQLSVNKFKWPELSTLSISESFKWWASYNKTFDGLSESKIGRAINAYSYLFDSRGGRDDPAKLFWALVGIEAIYVVGNSSLQDQVNKKSQIFLGERHEFKKTFSKMYDYRSRFVHGDLNFENKLFLNEKVLENHLSDFWTYRDFAISMLVCTFQKLIKENRHELDFDFTLKNNMA